MKEMGIAIDLVERLNASILKKAELAHAEEVALESLKAKYKSDKEALSELYAEERAALKAEVKELKSQLTKSISGRKPREVAASEVASEAASEVPAALSEATGAVLGVSETVSETVS